MFSEKLMCRVTTAKSTLVGKIGTIRSQDGSNYLVEFDEETPVGKRVWFREDELEVRSGPRVKVSE